MLREWTDLPSEQDRRTALALFTRIELLTSQLTEVEIELGDLISHEGDQRLVVVPDVAAMILRFRKQRNKLFPGIFGEPAWDILLTLGTLGPDEPGEPITSIGYAAEVPQTTALRHLAVLEMAGLVERTTHPDDKRSTLVRLTPLARERLHRSLEKWPLMVLLVAAPQALLFTLLW